MADNIAARVPPTSIEPSKSVQPGEEQQPEPGDSFKSFMQEGQTTAQPAEQAILGPEREPLRPSAPQRRRHAAHRQTGHRRRPPRSSGPRLSGVADPSPPGRGGAWRDQPEKALRGFLPVARLALPINGAFTGVMLFVLYYTGPCEGGPSNWGSTSSTWVVTWKSSKFL